jgi:hypothetical protein
MEVGVSKSASLGGQGGASSDDDDDFLKMEGIAMKTSLR